MATSNIKEYAHGQITKSDLQRLASIALEDLDDLFARKSKVSGKFRERILLLALCQGAALHYVDGKHGVKDLDVYAFFRARPDISFPSRRRKELDFGPSHLGRNPADKGYTGRRIDLMGRSIPVGRGQNAVGAVREYLASNKGSAGIIAERPVIGLYPPSAQAMIIWPVDSLSAP